MMQSARPRPITFKVTPKGARRPGAVADPARRCRTLLITAVLAARRAARRVIDTRAAGYVFLCLLGARLPTRSSRSRSAAARPRVRAGRRASGSPRRRRPPPLPAARRPWLCVARRGLACRRAARATRRAHAVPGPSGPADRPRGPMHADRPGHRRRRLHRQPHLRRTARPRLRGGRRRRLLQQLARGHSDRVEKVAGRPLLGAYEVDIRDRQALAAVFAAPRRRRRASTSPRKKAVGESVRIPLDYYDMNIGGTTGLLRAMHDHGVHRLVFSSSCSIYGDARPAAARRARPRRDRPTRTPLEVDLRAGARRRLPALPGAGGDRPALLQPGRRAPQRAARRGPARRAQQRDALPDAGRRSAGSNG